MMSNHVMFTRKDVKDDSLALLEFVVQLKRTEILALRSTENLHRQISTYYLTHHPLEHKLDVSSTLHPRAIEVTTTTQGKKERKHLIKHSKKCITQTGPSQKPAISKAPAKKSWEINVTVFLSSSPKFQKNTGQFFKNTTFQYSSNPLTHSSPCDPAEKEEEPKLQLDKQPC